jgi:GTPase SAR1 family protein
MDKETQFFIGELSSKIKPLLNTLENLTKCGLQKYLELPRIAVVGAQSTGKTSVLESIIGRSILPKGNDLATRLPIVLMLKRDPFMKSGDYRYKIGKNPNEIEEISYEEVGDRVNEFQNELAGTNYEIVDKKIYIQISASHVPELTLVDLPGIAKNRRKESKQPDDIQSLTTGIVEEYIKDDSTIILAVSSANQDIQTADAIQLANKADRDGKRTIGVLTKLDLMDKGTDAKKILEGEIIELKLGFVGVINRSQEMVNNGELIENALENEKIFFKNHDVYRKMDPSYFGSPNLSIKLMSILSKKIAEQLPKIKEEVENNLEEIQIILDGFGKPLPLNKKEKDSFFWNTISSVCKNIIERLQGKNDSEDTDIDPNFFILELRKCSHSIENLAIMKDKDRHQLIKKIQKKNTSPLPLFNLFESFYEIIKSQMSKFERPGEDLLKSIHEKMETVSKRVIEEDLKRFPNLKKKLSSLILDLLKDKNVDTSKKTKRLLYDV